MATECFGGFSAWGCPLSSRDGKVGLTFIHFPMTGTFVAAHLLRRGISLACHAHVTGQGGHVGLLGLLRPRVLGVVAAHVTTQGWFVLCVRLLLGLGTGQGEGGGRVP